MKYQLLILAVISSSLSQSHSASIFTDYFGIIDADPNNPSANFSSLDTSSLDEKKLELDFKLNDGNNSWELKKGKDTIASGTGQQLTNNSTGKSYITFVFRDLYIGKDVDVSIDGDNNGLAILSTGGFTLGAEVKYEGNKDSAAGDILFYSDGDMEISSKKISADGKKDASGGDVTIHSSGNLDLSAEVKSGGGDNQASGDILLKSGGDLVVSKKLESKGDAGSAGGNITLESAGNLELSGEVKSSGGKDADGGDISLQSGGDLSITSKKLEADGGDSGDGGNININSEGSLEVITELLSEGGKEGDGGDINIYADEEVFVQAKVDIAGGDSHKNNKGDHTGDGGDGGTITIEASEITLNDTSVTASGGDSDDKADGYGGDGGGFNLITDGPLNLEGYFDEDGNSTDTYFDLSGGKSTDPDAGSDDIYGEDGIAKLASQQVQFDGETPQNIEDAVDLFNQNNGYNDGGNSVIIAVPEPSTSILLMSGALIGSLRRKR